MIHLPEQDQKINQQDQKINQQDLMQASNLLSIREIEIVRLIAREYSNKEIARVLYITVGTVETHRRNIFQKMGAKNMAGLIHRAYQLGILRVDKKIGNH